MTTRDRWRRPAIRAAATGLTLLVLAWPGFVRGDDREDAIALYDAGEYAEARPLLEKIDTDGRSDGRLLYRLYYCQNVTGDAKARTTLRRAVELLESDPAPDYESSFYLANAYRNSGKLTDMARVANAAIARVESGKIGEPSSALEMFRLGKLYADVEKTEQASGWYARAIDHTDTASLPGPYVSWGSRFLADRAYDAGRLEEADKYYGRLLELNEATTADLDRLGSVRVRLRHYAEAAAAWRKSELLDPAQADRARYCGALARLAAGVEKLPEAAPDGRAWSELSQQELETIMSETATEAQETIANARAGERLDREMRAALAPGLTAAKARFAAAGLEYALRPFDIRQAAFSGGYAPMVFHAKNWRL